MSIISASWMARGPRIRAGSITSFSSYGDEAVTTLVGFRAAVVTGVIALAAASPLSAERLPVRTFTTADGLPRDQLNCVEATGADSSGSAPPKDWYGSTARPP